MWGEWFPDAPVWIPITALGMNILLFVSLLACLVANPIEAWNNRQTRRELDREVLDLKRFQKITADLMTAPTKQGVTAELARVGGHRKDA
jgi:hypothetical protein